MGFLFNIGPNASSLANYLEEFGKIPIPPYIRGGESDDLDKKDYQTVYAKKLEVLPLQRPGFTLAMRSFQS